MDKANKVSRKDQILQALARMLETAPGRRITTAALAKEVGVSEAALYRHFPSKARMFEGLIKFIDKNPGMTRLLTGDALAGETERLHERIAQFFSRLEAQLKQVLREAQIRENLKTTISPAVLANLLLASCEGRLVQFVRSEFKVSPLENWDTQWDFLSKNLLEPYSTSPETEATA
jgi:TetR/AcrR family transcriptional regulator